MTLIQTHHGDAPVCNLDFYSDEVLRNPVAAYHQMLDLGPVVWLPRNGLHAIVGFEALTTSLRNHRVFRSGKGVSINEEVNAFLIGSTLNSDPPDHDQTRAITFAPLTPRALKEVRARIEAEANIIAERVIELREFDAVSDLATHLPLSIVRDLVGLGAHGRENMLDWAGATFEMMGDPRDRRDKAHQNMGGLRAFLGDPDVLNALSPEGWANRATGLAIDAGIEPSRAISLMRDYIAPSLDTTISAISYAIWLFANHPAQWDKLRADRTLVANAIEEIVRLNTPIKTLSRYVQDDVDVAGFTLPAEGRALMMFGAANRDASKFPDPDRFDITRNTRGHVGFGHGVHACLGMHLARLEMTCLFNALADRITGFEIAGPPVPALNSAIHSLAHLPVRIST
ncbi:MAG: cytochrome P450 [Sedimentitalea sp.]